MSAARPELSRLAEITDKYSGVKLQCDKSGILKLTMDQWHRLALCRTDSRRCPDCGAIAEFV